MTQNLATRPSWLDDVPELFRDTFDKHYKWLNEFSGGRKATFNNTDFRGHDFSDVSACIFNDADFGDSDFRGMSLTNADFSRTNIRGVDFRGADLAFANFNGATIWNTDFRGATINEAVFNNVDICDVDFRGAYFLDATFCGTDLRDADFSDVKNDFIAAILYLPDEIPFLRQALIDGKIDGSTYRGECACLAGTMANACDTPWGDFESQNFMPIDISSPREQWFFPIQPGDTPENSSVVKLTVAWIDEVLLMLSMRGRKVSDGR